MVPDTEAIRFHCGINEDRWNHHPIAPGKYVCVSPVYGASARTKKENRVAIPKNCLVIQDSGAFCDGPGDRLDFRDALQRQVHHADKYRYADRITHRASYDLLIDEKWIDGVRRKRRWSEDEAWGAAQETIDAARYMLEWREKTGADIGLILSGQGVTPQQYLGCVSSFLGDHRVRHRDVLGLGGWCILGKMRSLMPSFLETIKLVVPFADSVGIRHIHIWGVMYAPALGALLRLCDKYAIKLSTDSSGPSVRPARGTWGYMGWVNKDYKRPPVEIRGLERRRHVEACREWLANFRETEWYGKGDS